LADLVRGKKVGVALATLRFADKRAALPFTKVIESAVANAKGQGKDESKLKIAKVSVEKGVVAKRFMPRARGSASRINKRSSHIIVELGE